MEEGGKDETLMVPMWKSAPWWPLVSTDGLHPYSFVKCWKVIPLGWNVSIGPVPGQGQLFTEEVVIQHVSSKNMFWPKL